MCASTLSSIKKYGEAVKMVGKTFLSGKGQTLDDYISYIQQPGHHGDELSLHLCAQMCQKQIAVIMKTGLVIGKLNNDCEDFIRISDCNMVLVYLGRGVFRGTKESSFTYSYQTSITKNKTAYI